MNYELIKDLNFKNPGYLRVGQEWFVWINDEYLRCMVGSVRLIDTMRQVTFYSFAYSKTYVINFNHNDNLEHLLYIPSVEDLITSLKNIIIRERDNFSEILYVRDGKARMSYYSTNLRETLIKIQIAVNKNEKNKN